MTLWVRSARGCLAALMLVSAAGAPARAAQCTPKTAGYFLQAEPSLKTVSPSTMAGIIASLTGSIGDPVRGRLIMADRERGNCLACHRVAVMSEEPNQGNLGPNLNAVGGRYTEAQLRQLIVDPKTLFPNTVMPAFHAVSNLARVPEGLVGKPVLSAGEVEDVIAFLKNLK